MRKIVLTCLVGVMALGGAATYAEEEELTDGQKAELYYKAGVKSMNAGDIEKAREYLGAAVKLNPNHGRANHSLRSLAANAPRLTARARKAALAKIHLEEVRMSEMEIDEAVVYLTELIDKKEPNYSPNIVLKGGAAEYSGQTVTLALRNIPASVVLDMLASNFGATVKFDQNTIQLRKAK